ncbi:MAG: T9SS type A sorting domain-containing protein [Ignavibacteriae bacterium]|nr:T9SS type A sorting domain-containing protein [Ignavibacteriota bacterium]
MKKTNYFLIIFFSFCSFAFSQSGFDFAANNVFTFADTGTSHMLKKFNMSIPYTLAPVGPVFSQNVIGLEFGGQGYLYYFHMPSSYNYELWRIDTATGTRTSVGVAGNVNGIINRGLAWDNVGKKMYVMFSTSPSKLYTVNLNTGAMTFFTNLSANDYIIGFAVNNAGSMFGISTFGTKLVRINQTNGTTTDIGLLGVTLGDVYGCDFDPLTGKMYLMSNSNIYRIDTATGAATLTGSIAGSAKYLSIGGGLYTGISKLSAEIPSSVKLYDNYPNPFNPSTKIKFDVASLSFPNTGNGIHFVSLKIFDMLGREAATLVNSKLSPGTYEVSWNASGNSSGMYFYQLSVDNANYAVKKMALTK